MYEVIKDGEVICTINNVCYVVYRPLIHSWCVCEPDQSQAIWCVPVVEEGAEPQQSFYARLEFQPVIEESKDFPLVEVVKVSE